MFFFEYAKLPGRLPAGDISFCQWTCRIPNLGCSVLSRKVECLLQAIAPRVWRELPPRTRCAPVLTPPSPFILLALLIYVTVCVSSVASNHAHMLFSHRLWIVFFTSFSAFLCLSTSLSVYNLCLVDLSFPHERLSACREGRIGESVIRDCCKA